jgi:hypothetical protein
VRLTIHLHVVRKLIMGCSCRDSQLKLYKDFFVVKGPAADATDAPQP